MNKSFYDVIFEVVVIEIVWVVVIMFVGCDFFFFYDIYLFISFKCLIVRKLKFFFFLIKLK